LSAVHHEPMTNETLTPTQTLSRVQTAKAVGVVESTVREYERVYNVPFVRMPNGHCHHSVESIPIMQAIKSMKKAGLSDADIKLNIAQDLEQVRARLRELPEASGVDSKEVANEVAKQMAGEITESGHQLLMTLLHVMQQDNGGLRQALGAAEAKVELYEGQAKLLPEKAESLRDAEEKIRWAQAAQARAEEESRAAADAMLELRAQVRTLEVTEQQRQGQFVQTQLELRHAQARQAELEAELEESRAQSRADRNELVAQAGKLGSAEATIKMLERDLAAEQQALEALKAERSKSWLDKFTTKK
jgi:DNA-binding transcriptional MerR regulator